MLIHTDGLIHALQLLFPLPHIQEALQCAKSQNQTLLNYLIHEQRVDSLSIAKACANYFSLKAIDLHQYSHLHFPLHHLNDNQLRSQAILPIEQANDELTLAISDPAHFFLTDEIKFQTQLKIKIVFAPYDQLTLLTSKILTKTILKSLRENKNFHTDETIAATLIERLLNDAVFQNASDLHCEPMRHHYQIRLRIDDILYPTAQLPSALVAPLTSRLKIMAELDISEKRLPQDGRFTFMTTTKLHRDCRISSLPTLFGEKIVVRILNPQTQLLDIHELGLEEKPKQQWIHAIQQSQGFILVTGPTGSGKTNSLYTALQSLNTPQKNIITIEEPVEIQLDGINHINVNHKTGLDFSAALRALLRQDPDIIMVGEIRDTETANMAIRAAHTGHLVLSTLHTNSAAETLSRLLHMGISAFNVASSVSLIIAQRLLRKLCHYCKTPIRLPPTVLLQAGFKAHEATTVTLYQANQCEFCIHGYKGRVGVFEVMPISPALRELILQQAPAQTINAAAEKEGVQSLKQSALNKARDGITSLEEINRVIGIPTTTLF